MAIAEEGVPIEPGEWEMTATTTSATLEQPNTQSTTKCIELSSISPLDLTPSRGECNISESSKTGDTINWKVGCKLDVGTMEGVGTFTTYGDTADGKMNLDMHVQNDKFTMQVKWEARRLGDCQ